MAAVSLFWDTNMAAVTSCENSIDVIDMKMTIYSHAWGGEVPLGILGGGVPSRSPNPDPISDQNMKFSTPAFRLDL